MDTHGEMFVIFFLLKKKMPTLVIDSRQRLSGTTANAQFALSNEMKVNQLHVKIIQFANTLFNISENNNAFVLLDATSVIIPPGFYSPAEIAALLAPYITGISNNVITWNLASPINYNLTTLREVIGLNAGTLYTGVFTTQLFLAIPLNLDFVCNQLQPSARNQHIYSTRSKQTQPFVTCPVLGGHNEMSTYEPNFLDPVQIGTRTIMLDMQVQDSSTGRIVNEISHWSVLIEFN